jgi:hypothetical protein
MHPVYLQHRRGDAELMTTCNAGKLAAESPLKCGVSGRAHLWTRPNRPAAVVCSSKTRRTAAPLPCSCAVRSSPCTQQADC